MSILNRAKISFIDLSGLNVITPLLGYKGVLVEKGSSIDSLKGVKGFF